MIKNASFTTYLIKQLNSISVEGYEEEKAKYAFGLTPEQYVSIDKKQTQYLCKQVNDNCHQCIYQVQGKFVDYEHPCNDENYFDILLCENIEKIIVLCENRAKNLENILKIFETRQDVNNVSFESAIVLMNEIERLEELIRNYHYVKST